MSNSKYIISNVLEANLVINEMCDKTLRSIERHEKSVATFDVHFEDDDECVFYAIIDMTMAQVYDYILSLCTMLLGAYNDEYSHTRIYVTLSN